GERYWTAHAQAPGSVNRSSPGCLLATGRALTSSDLRPPRAQGIGGLTCVLTDGKSRCEKGASRLKPRLGPAAETASLPGSPLSALRRGGQGVRTGRRPKSAPARAKAMTPDRRSL